ncbi:sensor domain-containing phosphodiesterase [Actinomycetospora termitidis]|uniref:EAL domain-containing protein n=1 Tax=Actinomycetospora termitidis TaxID=3053470 RepID=A0ABT7M8D5_9PSEU|nr:EAL domain-containing protein [Actinomycetospora sp. Odt1-22]MDL5156934.1 EAL domain-containing protein [Actinomycetospora sp. Odt1-22]
MSRREGPRVQLDDVTPDESAALHAVLAERAVTPVLQPVADVVTGEVVGLEALARGPAGPVERPDRLFAAARAEGLVHDLDDLCRRRAVEVADEAGLSGPFGLFVNVEPEAAPVDVTPGPASVRLLDRGVTVVLELTERDLTGDPGRLLAFAEAARAEGFRIALDDVGAEPASLALMPFLRPEVVKLDLSLVQGRDPGEVAEIVSAVAAYAEQSDAIVLAEGVETADQLATARGLGATLAQGWWVGTPEPAADVVPGLVPPRVPPRFRLRMPEAVPHSPFQTVARSRTARRAPKSLLVAVSRHLERQAAAQGDLAVVLAAYEDAENLTPGSRRRYRDLAASAAFVGVLGRGVAAEPEPGVRGADLLAEDPVNGEWDIAVVGPHFAAALVARDLDPDGDPGDPAREFDHVLTHDRTLVLEVARSLMARVVPHRVRNATDVTDASPVGVASGTRA